MNARKFGKAAGQALAAGAGVAGGILAWGATGAKIPIANPYAKAGVTGLAGILIGGLLSRVRGLGNVAFGVGAGLTGSALLMLAGNVIPSSAWPAGVSVPLSGSRFNLNQMDPNAYQIHGLGRTRVVEQFPGAYELNAYEWSGRYGMHGLGQPNPRYYGWATG